MSRLRNVEQEAITRLASPDDRIEVVFSLNDDGVPHYTVTVDGEPLVAPSRLGFRFQEAPPLERGFVVERVEESSADETWQPVWGASAEVRNHYREAAITLREEEGEKRMLTIVLRAHDDGVGFRYVFPEQDALPSFAVTKELTEFRFADEGTVWWTPADYDSYEHFYEETSLVEAEDANTPITVRTTGDTFASIHEAALLDFPGMTLAKLDDGGRGYRAGLIPLPETGGIKAYVDAPFETPWRTIMIGRAPGDLIESNLILNLNEPCTLDDTSWIEPGTYIGIWWLIHKGQATWHPGEHAGATTERAKQYIDFAGMHGIPYVLVEGWNVGWTGNWTEMDFTQPQEHFDLEEVVQYAKDRGVSFIAHMETGANPHQLEEQMDDAFALYRKLGIRAIKTGYVGDIPGHHHSDQWMVQHHQRVVEKAAKYGIMVDAHEPVKPTGLERTWPNAITREAVRGMEYNAWTKGNPPSHTATLPFTRMLAGPLDYTPGIFNVTWDPPKLMDSEVYLRRKYHGPTRVHSTRARQMALPVILLSGLQMLADLPEHYEGQPEFSFFRHLPATWDDTRVLSGEIGRHLVIARRSGDTWFIAAITDESYRPLEIPLHFLDEGVYRAHMYGDADGTDYQRRPNEVAIRRKKVTSEDALQVELGGGGGWVARLVPEW